MSIRRILEVLSLAGVLFTAWMTAAALYGPGGLPARIATHFDAAGNANAWGSRGALLAVPLTAILLYILMSVVSRYPSAFNYPVRVTPKNRPRLEALALEMIAWLKAEIVWLFAWIQHITLDLARHGRGSLSPLFMPFVLAVVFATILIYVLAMRRVGKSDSRA